MSAPATESGYEKLARLERERQLDHERRGLAATGLCDSCGADAHTGKPCIPGQVALAPYGTTEEGTTQTKEQPMPAEAEQLKPMPIPEVELWLHRARAEFLAAEKAHLEARALAARSIVSGEESVRLAVSDLLEEAKRKRKVSSDAYLKLRTAMSAAHTAGVL